MPNHRAIELVRKLPEAQFMESSILSFFGYYF